MSEYLELRARALEHNSTIPDSHPCRKGNGRCCKDQIPVVMGDIDYIVEGILSKKITEDLVKQAISRAQDPIHEGCPFLDEQNRCTIYKNRPVICIITGAAGLPSKEETFTNAVQEYERTGKDPCIPVSKTGSSMCFQCHDELASAGAKFTTTAVFDMSEIADHYLTTPQTTMREFVLKTLST